MDDGVAGAGRAGLATPRRSNRGVALVHLPRTRALACRYHLVSRRQKPDLHGPDIESGDPVGEECTDIAGTDQVPGREDQVSAHDLLPGGVDMLPGCCGLSGEPDPIFPGDIFDHDDRVVARRDSVSGVHPAGVFERDGVSVACSACLAAHDGKTIPCSDIGHWDRQR